MTLDRLLADWTKAPPTPISALTLDSREVGPGAAFVALDGGNTHGLRHAAQANARGAVPLDRTRAEEEAAIVADYQFRDGEARVRGGFCFGTRDGRRMPFVNPVSTAFCAQAIAMWQSGPGELADLI